MIKKLLFLVCIGTPIMVSSQIAFTNSSSLLVNENVTSGCAIGVADMNNDGRDDIIRLDDARDLEIEYQNASTDGSGNLYTRYDFGAVGGSQWGLCIADVDENGYNDIFTGGAYNGLKLITASSDGSSYSSTTQGGPNIFLQNVNFADIDNDGSIDVFACHDEGISSPYKNNGSGTLTHDANLIVAASTIPSDNSGNYGTIWIDYDNDGDQDLYISKCRLGVGNSTDGRRVNLLFQNDGNGNFTDVAESAGLRPLEQSWSAAFEDIDNDGDLDCVLINHTNTNQIYENNGNGTFTDITSTSGIATQLDDLGTGGIQVMMEDFDNDSYIDLFITSRWTSDKHIMFKNNGNKTFSEVSGAISAGSLSVQSAAVGDLNNDGFIDVLAGFATGYNSPSGNADRLYLNNGNANNWSKIRLQGVTSNLNGIGARVELYTALGKQIREVRSGESYGTMNSLVAHFGIASETTITKIVVRWPSGLVDQLSGPAINQSHLIIEGSNPLTTDSFTASNFNVYPNPAHNKVTITTDLSEDMSLAMYDITGKLILTSNNTFNNQTDLDISALNSGVYFMHLSSGSKKYVHKLIKE
ncbi:FG-GAP-like repeat-containing protein [Lacinutrix iliipiscaria]|uniref:FG-GAP-like repeat-containing protein n=1 Tax=Lacinutrix iliipiscaria TaxID=1230532 RepID=A0ABW5WSZ5_9FLAO